jgi:hypothetical protein
MVSRILAVTVLALQSSPTRALLLQSPAYYAGQGVCVGPDHFLLVRTRQESGHSDCSQHSAHPQARAIQRLGYSHRRRKYQIQGSKSEVAPICSARPIAVTRTAMMVILANVCGACAYMHARAHMRHCKRMPTSGDRGCGSEPKDVVGADGLAGAPIVSSRD